MQTNIEKTRTHQEIDRPTVKEVRKRRQETKQLLISFLFMISLTTMAFIAVGSASIPDGFAAFFILLLAVIQVSFQFFVFMHLKDKGHGLPKVGISGGIFFAVVIVIGLMIWIWWS